jgi:arylsulfatase A-like enzyme
MIFGAEQAERYGRGGVSFGYAAQPFLNSLWDTGLRLENHFAESFCSPYRACHMTGRHTEDLGLGDIIETDNDQPLLLRELLIPEALRIYFGNRIQTACIGKWHLGNAQVGGKKSPLTAGFDYFYGSERNITDFYNFDLVLQGDTVNSNGRYIPELLAQAAIGWLRRFASQSSQKGYLYLPFHLPHNPFFRPPSTLYNAGTWTLPGYQPAAQDDITAVPYHKAYIEAMDTLLARIIGTIPASLLQETVLFVSSDNGTEAAMLAFEQYPPGLGGGFYQASHGKRTAFDPGIRTPAYIWSANTAFVTSPGRSITGLAQSLDWYSTTLDLFGVPWQEIVAAQGPRFGVSAAERSKSLLPNMQAALAATDRTHAMGGIWDPNGYNRGTTAGRRWITDGTDKLTFQNMTAFGVGTHYNILSDPRETGAVVGGAAERAALEAAWADFYETLPPVPPVAES